jgi:hypothetical protein
MRQTSLLAFCGGSGKRHLLWFQPPGERWVPASTAHTNYRVFQSAVELSLIVNPLIGSTYLVAGVSFSFTGNQSDNQLSPQSTTMLRNRLFDPE